MDKRNKLKLEEDVEKLSKLLSYVQERSVPYTEKQLSPVYEKLSSMQNSVEMQMDVLQGKLKNCSSFREKGTLKHKSKRLKKCKEDIENLIETYNNLISKLASKPWNPKSGVNTTPLFNVVKNLFVFFRKTIDKR